VGRARFESAGRGSTLLRARAVLSLQRSAGNRAVLARVGRAQSRVLQRTYAELFDYDATRDELYRQLTAGNEIGVFEALQPLQRDVAALAGWTRPTRRRSARRWPPRSRPG